MKLNMNEFDTYLNNEIFNKGIDLIFEIDGNPKMYCRLDKALFRHDIQSVQFSTENKSFVTIKNIKEIEIDNKLEAITTIIIHTDADSFDNKSNIKFWHLNTNLLT